MKNKKGLIVNICIIILGVIILFLAYNDDFLYKKEIMKITSVKEKLINEKQGFGSFSEKYYEQSIQGIVLNGKYKGMKVNATNERSTSNVYDETYHKGDKVFITFNNVGLLISCLNFRICLFFFLGFINKLFNNK